jgi:hypothetical protein
MSYGVKFILDFLENRLGKRVAKQIIYVILLLHPSNNRTLQEGHLKGIILQKTMEEKPMPRYNVTLSTEEREELQLLIQKGRKGYRTRHAQILLKLDKIPENKEWTYDRITDAYGSVRSTIANIAKRFVFEGIEAALGRNKHDNYHRKVTGEVEAKICMIACSDPPDGRSRWTMQMIANELIRLKVVDYITDSTVCEVMKKTKLSRGLPNNGAYPKQALNL